MFAWTESVITSQVRWKMEFLKKQRKFIPRKEARKRENLSL